MRSSNTIKSACLTVGLATAWAPMTDRAALADSVPYSVDLTFGQNTTPFPFDDSYIAFLLSSNDVAVYDLGPLSNTTSYSFQAMLTSAPSQFIAIGRDGGHVIASIADSSQFSTFDWGTVFAGFDEGAIIGAMQAHGGSGLATTSSFLQAAFSISGVPATFTGSSASAPLYEFSDGYGVGDITVDVAAQAITVVPLPGSVMMGSTLLGLMLLSTTIRPWFRAGQEP